MKTMSAFLVLCLMVLTIGCASVYDVSYDYDPKANFAGLKTYDWLPVPVNTEINRFNIKRMQHAVNTELEARGLETRSDNPDFLIATHIGKNQGVKVTDWGYGYGPHGGYWGHGGRIDVWQYEEGTLILDFVDANSKDLIWRGSAKAELDSTITPEEAQKLINEAVQKILENFPPPGSK